MTVERGRISWCKEPRSQRLETVDISNFGSRQIMTDLLNINDWMVLAAIRRVKLTKDWNYIISSHLTLLILLVVVHHSGPFLSVHFPGFLQVLCISTYIRLSRVISYMCHFVNHLSTHNPAKKMPQKNDKNSAMGWWFYEILLPKDAPNQIIQSALHPPWVL